MNENPNSEIENSAEIFRQRKNEKEIESAVERVSGNSEEKHLAVFQAKKYAKVLKREIQKNGFHQEWQEFIRRNFHPEIAAAIEKFAEPENSESRSDEPQFLKREN